MRLIPVSLTLLVLFSFVTSCSEVTKERSLNEKFTAYANHNHSVIISGNVKVQAFLDNADFKHIPKLNNLISKELTAFKQGIYLDSGLYFSIEGLLGSQGNPSEVNVFAPLKNKDSIREKIASLGLLLEHGKNLDYALGPNFGIGIQENVVLFHYQEQGTITSKTFSSIFQRLNKKARNNVSNMTTNDALRISTHLDHIYKLYQKNNAITLDKLKQKEVEKLLSNAKLSTTLTFEKGGITINTKHQFSENLKKRMIFDASSNTNYAKLAHGKATLGLSMHLDPLKIQTMLEDFNPEFFEQLGAMQGNIALGILAMGDRPVSNLLGGQLAFVYYGSDDSHSAYLTLGDEGRSISNLTRSFFSNNPMYNLIIHEKEIAATSKNHTSNRTNLILPRFANDFGSHGIDFFFDIHNFNQNQPTLVDEYPFLRVISWIKITATNDGSTIRIQGNHPNKGILKQVVDAYIELIKSEISMYS